MSDMADWLTEQGLDAEAEHDTYGCEFSPCQICVDREATRKETQRKQRNAKKVSK
jgi:hypothetical protein